MASTVNKAPVEYFSVPDDAGPIKASDMYAYDRLRVITDAHSFIVPGLILLAAFFLWLSLRLLGVGRIGRLLKLWLAAKERELKTRAGEPD
jgi:hypothetical protein